MNDPFAIFDNIRTAYLRYLDSPFRLRYDALLEERRALLDQDHLVAGADRLGADREEPVRRLGRDG